jgi:hypothetical protein
LGKKKKKKTLVHRAYIVEEHQEYGYKHVMDHEKMAIQPDFLQLIGGKDTPPL